MIIFRALSIWIMMGLLSWGFVYIFVIFSKWLFTHSPSMVTGWSNIINDCDEIMKRITDVGVFLMWLVKGPVMMVYLIKTLIDAFIR